MMMNLQAIRSKYREVFPRQEDIEVFLDPESLGTLFIFTKSCNLMSLKDGGREVYQEVKEERLERFMGKDERRAKYFKLIYEGIVYVLSRVNTATTFPAKTSGRSQRNQSIESVLDLIAKQKSKDIHLQSRVTQIKIALKMVNLNYTSSSDDTL